MPHCWSWWLPTSRQFLSVPPVLSGEWMPTLIMCSCVSVTCRAEQVIKHLASFRACQDKDWDIRKHFWASLNLSRDSGKATCLTWLVLCCSQTLGNPWGNAHPGSTFWLILFSCSSPTSLPPCPPRYQAASQVVKTNRSSASLQLEEGQWDTLLASPDCTKKICMVSSITSMAIVRSFSSLAYLLYHL